VLDLDMFFKIKNIVLGVFLLSIEFVTLR